MAVLAEETEIAHADVTNINTNTSKIFYVNNHGQAVDVSELESLFTSVGDVESFRMEIHQESQREFGVVEMKTEQQAQDCIERFHGQFVIGQTLSVSASKPKFQVRKLK